MRLLLVSILLAVSLVATPVLAEEQLASPPAASAQPAGPADLPMAADAGSNWSIGAGSSFNFPGTSSSQFSAALPVLMGGFGTVDASRPPTLRRAEQPSLSLFVERRLGAANWLLAQAELFHDTATDDLKTNLESKQTTTEINLGVRHVFNPEGVIQVSGFVLGGVGYTRLFQRGEEAFRPEGSFEYSVRMYDYVNTVWSAGASAGLAFERKLLDRFALRFSSNLLRASYFKATSREMPEDAAADEHESHGLDFGLWFAPSIELRYYL